MGNTFGNTLHLTIFGESHGTAIGCVIDGLPAGIAIDWDKVSFEMRRRAPGSSLWQRQGRKRMNLKSFPVTLTATRKGIPLPCRSETATSTRKTTAVSKMPCARVMPTTRAM